MENTIKPGVRIKVSTLYKSILGVGLVLAIIFTYLYFINQGALPKIRIPFSGPNEPTFSHFIYGGFGEEQLWKPMDVTTIGDKVFVADTNNQRVQIFTKSGEAVSIFGSKGSKPGQFEFPYGITGDNQGRLMVADMYLGTISVFDQSGKFIEYFGEKSDVGKYVKSPTDIVFSEGKLYVADVKVDRVFIFDEKGKLLQELGKNKEFGAPNGIAVDKKNGVTFVVDTRNERVVLYDDKGKAIGQFNGTEGAKGQSMLSNPRGIVFDSRGVVYVVSTLSNSVLGFGKKVEPLFIFGTKGNGEGQFSLPNGMHIDEDNLLYITDTVNGRVAVYR